MRSTIAISACASTTYSNDKYSVSCLWCNQMIDVSSERLMLLNTLSKLFRLQVTGSCEGNDMIILIILELLILDFLVFLYALHCLGFFGLWGCNPCFLRLLYSVIRNKLTHTIFFDLCHCSLCYHPLAYKSCPRWCPSMICARSSNRWWNTTSLFSIWNTRLYPNISKIDV